MDNQITPLKQSELSAFRIKLLHDQQSICPICGKEVQAPCLDHSHTKRVKGTGLVRGVLCRMCNVLLAKMENNCLRYNVSQKELPNVLRNMADYLEQPCLPFLHPSEIPKPPKLMKSSYNELKRRIIQEGAKIPDYPKSKKLTIELDRLFKKYNLSPKFYL